MAHWPDIACGLVLDEKGFIRQDLRCVSCCYNLRGLTPDGRCPECGVPIGRSSRGDLLRYRDPTWLETLAGGMNWILASVLLNVLMYCLTPAVQSAVVHQVQGRLPSTVWLWLYLAVVGTTTLTRFIGYWMVATPDPGRERRQGLTVRRIVRILAIVNLLVTGLQILVGGLPRVAVSATGMISTATEGVAVLAALLYARLLALRLPDESLAFETRTVMWGLGIIMVTACLTILIAAIISPVAANPFAADILTLAGCLAFPLAFAVIIFASWTIALVSRYRFAFHDAARFARATWASTGTA